MTVDSVRAVRDVFRLADGSTLSVKDSTFVGNVIQRVRIWVRSACESKCEHKMNLFALQNLVRALDQASVAFENFVLQQSERLSVSCNKA